MNFSSRLSFSMRCRCGTMSSLCEPGTKCMQPFTFVAGCNGIHTLRLEYSFAGSQYASSWCHGVAAWLCGGLLIA